MRYMNEDGEIESNCEDCFYKTPYNHNTLTEAKRTALTCNDKSLTDQSFREDADINIIMDRIQRGAAHDIPLPEHFGTDERVDLYTARSRIAESNATFYNLAPHIRAQFLNDPGRWEQAVTAALNAGSRTTLRDMGLDVPEPPEAAVGGTPAPTPPEETDKVKK